MCGRSMGTDHSISPYNVRIVHIMSMQMRVVGTSIVHNFSVISFMCVYGFFVFCVEQQRISENKVYGFGWRVYRIYVSDCLHCVVWIHYHVIQCSVAIHYTDTENKPKIEAISGNKHLHEPEHKFQLQNDFEEDEKKIANCEFECLCSLKWVRLDHACFYYDHYILMTYDANKIANWLACSHFY